MIDTGLYYVDDTFNTEAFLKYILQEGFCPIMFVPKDNETLREYTESLVDEKQYERFKGFLVCTRYKKVIV